MNGERRWMLMLVLVAALCGPLWADGTIQRMHEQMLYPACRVSTGSVGGSGTLLYSEDRGGGCQSYVLTNHHVISAGIEVREEWSSLLQADRKSELLEFVEVEVFRYAAGSRQDVTDSYRAEIVAHNKRHDLALVKLQTDRKLPFVARMLPESEDKTVTIFEPIWAIGCSLGHPPVQTAGHINYLDDVIDRKFYWMGSADIIYGNSGGAVFLRRRMSSDSNVAMELSGALTCLLEGARQKEVEQVAEDIYYFIGVPSRVSVTWGQAITHMGYFVPIPRVRKWLKDEELLFLLDKKSTPRDCFAKREELQRRAEFKLLKDMRGE